jgi:ATP-dependent Zn protease
MNDARKILTEHMSFFTNLAETLIERETLNADEIQMIRNGEELPPLNGKKKEKPESLDKVV